MAAERALAQLAEDTKSGNEKVKPHKKQLKTAAERFIWLECAAPDSDAPASPLTSLAPATFRCPLTRLRVRLARRRGSMLCASQNLLDGRYEDADAHPKGTDGYAARKEDTDTLFDGALEFVYVDATHLYADAARDLAAWWPKLRVGGVMAGDDYFNGYVPHAKYTFGVKDAVDEFAAARNHRVYISGQAWMDEGSALMQQWYMLKCAD